MNVLPFGDRALLAEYPDLDATLRAYGALEATRPHGVVALVPAARTVLARIDPAVLPLSVARRWLHDQRPLDEAPDVSTSVTVHVRYDGPDLAETAALLGLSPEGLVSRHRDAGWRSAFAGFAPGFSYLVSDAWPIEVPRLATSRPVVPAGAVALASEFTGIYPRPSPGGWRIIGSTDAPLWDVDRAAPALLPPGALVRFEERP